MGNEQTIRRVGRINENENDVVNDANEVYSHERSQRNRLNENYEDENQRQVYLAQQATERAAKQSAQELNREAEMLRTNREKQEKDLQRLQYVTTTKNERVLSSAKETAEKKIEEQKEECGRWEKQNNANQEQLEKIRLVGDRNEEQLAEERKEVNETFRQRREVRQTKYDNEAKELKDQSGQIRNAHEKHLSQLAEDQRSKEVATAKQLTALTESQITGTATLRNAAVLDQEHSAYCNSAGQLRNQFENVQKIINSQNPLWSKAVYAMKMGTKLKSKPETDRVTNALSELDSGIQRFTASDKKFEDLQKAIQKKVTELTASVTEIETGLDSYEPPRAVDFTEQHKKVNEVLLELKQLFLSFNVNKESHASKAISDEITAVRSGEAFVSTERGNDGQIGKGQGQHSLGNR